MRTLSVSRDDLDQAAAEGLIAPKDTAALWNFLEKRLGNDTQSKFDLSNLAWYAGSVIVMLAMGWIMGQVWDAFSGGGIVATAVVYALGFTLAGARLWKTNDLKIPGGLLFTLAVSMTPLAVFGIERMSGLWGGIQPFPAEFLREFSLEAATIGAGLLALYFVRFPFLTAPVSLALWCLTMSTSSFVASFAGLSFHQEWLVTLLFGAGMIIASFIIDRFSREDFAFWGYLFGTAAFWSALTWLLAFDSSSELARASYAAVNVAMLLVSVLLNRRVFVIAGAVGTIGYIGHLSWAVFAGSWAFPFALSFVGIAIIYLGVQLHRNRDSFEKAILGLVPESLRDWLPSSRN